MKSAIGKKVFYSPDEFPKLSSNSDFSVDVFVMDENGVHGIAFYDYVLNRWMFHTDTLVDYFAEGTSMRWKWYYPPFERDDVMFNCSLNVYKILCYNIMVN